MTSPFDKTHETRLGGQIVHIWHQDGSYVQLSAGRLFVLYTTGPASSTDIERLVHNFDHFASSTPGRLGFVLATSDTARPPDEGDRKRVTDMLARHVGRLAGVAVCIHGSGFSAALVRSVASAVFVFHRGSYPAKVFSSISEAARWMSEQMDSPAYLLRTTVEHAVAMIEDAAKNH